MFHFPFHMQMDTVYIHRMQGIVYIAERNISNPQIAFSLADRVRMNKKKVFATNPSAAAN